MTKKEKYFWIVYKVLFVIIFIWIFIEISFIHTYLVFEKNEFPSLVTKEIDKVWFYIKFISLNILISSISPIIILFPTQFILRFFIKKSKLKGDNDIIQPGFVVSMMCYLITFGILLEESLDSDQRSIINQLFYIIASFLTFRYIYKATYDSSNS